MTAVFPVPRRETGFGNERVEWGRIVEQFFDVPGREAERIVARREIAFRQQPTF